MTRIHKQAIPAEKLEDYRTRASRVDGDWFEFKTPPPAKAPMAGLGDLVERVVHAILIPVHSWSGRMLAGFCGCAKRKRWLNRIFPFRRRLNDSLPT